MLLAITITGFWPIVGTILTVGALCFCIGVGVGRNNAAKLSKALDGTQADLEAVKGQLAKLQAGAEKVIDAVKKV